jgi:hypothetical protein
LSLAASFIINRESEKKGGKNWEKKVKPKKKKVFVVDCSCEAACVMGNCSLFPLIYSAATEQLITDDLLGCKKPKRD